MSGRIIGVFSFFTVLSPDPVEGCPRRGVASSSRVRKGRVVSKRRVWICTRDWSVCRRMVKLSKDSAHQRRVVSPLSCRKRYPIHSGRARYRQCVSVKGHGQAASGDKWLLKSLHWASTISTRRTATKGLASTAAKGLASGHFAGTTLDGKWRSDYARAYVVEWTRALAYNRVVARKRQRTGNTGAVMPDVDIVEKACFQNKMTSRTGLRTFQYEN